MTEPWPRCFGLHRYPDTPDRKGRRTCERCGHIEGDCPPHLRHLQAVPDDGQQAPPLDAA